jgi:hypothetical protein
MASAILNRAIVLDNIIALDKTNIPKKKHFQTNPKLIRSAPGSNPCLGKI